MNGLLGKIAVGLLCPVPLAGIAFVITKLLPQVSAGEISWFSVVIAAALLALFSLGLMIGLVIHAARNPDLGTAGRISWIVALFLLLPISSLAYWGYAWLRVGKARVSSS